MKHRGYLFLITIIISLFVTACVKNDSETSVEPSDKEIENLNDSGFPIVKDEITLDFFAGQQPATHPDWNDVLIFNEYEKITNMNIEWEMVSHESLSEKLQLTLGGGNLPDAFHSARISMNDMSKYGEQGVLIPLNDLIDDYAPNFKKILDEHPIIKKSITHPDGNIYSFPTMSDPSFTSSRLGARPFIHKQWLESLNMDMPETTDEFYQFLKSVKEDSPSNGEIDEVPFGGPYIDTLITYLQGSFGLANKGGSNPYLDEDPETGKLRFFPISDQYKEMIEFVHKLYEEELIEQNIYTIDHHQFISNLSEGQYGSVVWYAPEEVASKEHGKYYVGMPALEGPHGDKGIVQHDPVDTPGAFVITNKNEFPAATVRWVDYFYGDEGMTLFYMGIEGETYEINDEGNPEYMDHILNNEEGLTFEEAAAKYLTFPGGGYPGNTTAELYKGVASAPQSIEAAEKVEPDLLKDDDVWTTFTHTKDEISQLQGFGSDIEKYVIEMRDKFISGNEPLSKWDEYVKEIEGMGLEDYLKIKQAALDRQLKDE